MIGKHEKCLQRSWLSHLLLPVPGEPALSKLLEDKQCEGELSCPVNPAANIITVKPQVSEGTQDWQTLYRAKDCTET